jgi:hypothetical protein
VQLRGHRVGGLSLEVSREGVLRGGDTPPQWRGWGPNRVYPARDFVAPDLEKAANAVRPERLPRAADEYRRSAPRRERSLPPSVARRGGGRAEGQELLEMREPPYWVLDPWKYSEDERLSQRARSVLLASYPPRFGRRHGAWGHVARNEDRPFGTASRARPANSSASRSSRSFEHRRWPTSTSSPSLLLPEGC